MPDQSHRPISTHFLFSIIHSAVYSALAVLTFSLTTQLSRQLNDQVLLRVTFSPFLHLGFAFPVNGCLLGPFSRGCVMQSVNLLVQRFVKRSYHYFYGKCLGQMMQWGIIVFQWAQEDKEPHKINSDSWTRNWGGPLLWTPPSPSPSPSPSPHLLFNDTYCLSLLQLLSNVIQAGLCHRLSALNPQTSEKLFFREKLISYLNSWAAVDTEAQMLFGA